MTDTLDSKIKWLESMFSEGKISKNCYESTLKILTEKIIPNKTFSPSKSYSNQKTEQNVNPQNEVEEIEENLKIMLKKYPHADVKYGRLYIELQCPKCGTVGANHSHENEFKYLGKDERDFMYFRCPNCRKHIKYDVHKGRIKKRMDFFLNLIGKA